MRSLNKNPDDSSLWMKGSLRFSYIAADQREPVVFNRRAGLGMICTATLYGAKARG